MTNATHTLLLPNQVDETLAAHFAALGVGTISAYKLWCHRHGLSTALDKTPQEQSEERALFAALQPSVDPSASKEHDPRRAALIRRLFNGELEDEKLNDLLSRLRVERNALASDPAAQQALGRLVLHVEKYGHLLRPMPVLKRLGANRANTYIAALGQLARHHRDWLRPVEEWRPSTAKERPQFQSLARHLLARYEVPAPMDTAWLQGHTAEAYQQQEWFKHVAGGQNLRTAGVPMKVTKRMAHIFMQMKHPHHTLLQALRIAQAEALGGDSHCSWYVAATPLGDSLENEAFWISVIHFYVNNYPMLHRTYFLPVYDYIRHQKYLPQQIEQPDGTQIAGPPPQPNFCMKGRSAAKLLNQVDEWHETLSGAEDVPLKTWAATDSAGFRLEEYDAQLKCNLVWTICELCTSQQLQTEGRIMGHCVFSYTDRCLTGDTSIWSLRVLNADSEEALEKRVLTIAVDNRQRAVTQARGKFNMALNQRERLEKRRRAGSLYVHLLRESARILRLWSDKVGLVQKSM